MDVDKGWMGDDVCVCSYLSELLSLVSNSPDLGSSHGVVKDTFKRYHLVMTIR